MSTISKAVKHYGWKGLFIYLQIKTGNAGSLRIPGIKNAIRLRKKSDDLKLFKQLMIHKEYEFTSPVEPIYIIDAGANIGLSSVFFAATYPDSEIIAIEPQNDNYALLTENTKNYTNIKCIKAGLWHKSTILEVADSGGGTASFMVNETNPSNLDRVVAMSTEEILKMHNWPFVDLFKIDIEGAEKEVLSENTDWLSKTKILIIELHDRKKAGCSKAFFNAFKDRNFECHPFGQNFLLYNKEWL